MGLYGSLATAKVSLDRVQQISEAEPEVVESTWAVELTTVWGRACQLFA